MKKMAALIFLLPVACGAQQGAPAIDPYFFCKTSLDGGRDLTVAPDDVFDKIEMRLISARTGRRSLVKKRGPNGAYNLVTISNEDDKIQTVETPHAVYIEEACIKRTTDDILQILRTETRALESGTHGSIRFTNSEENRFIELMPNENGYSLVYRATYFD